MKLSRHGARAERRPSLARLAIAAVSVVALFLGACSSSRATRYPPAHVGVAHKIDRGTVVATREVVIDGQSSNLGRVAGGAIGGAVGAVSAGDGGAQRTVGAAVGGAVGAVVANQVEKKLTEQRAQELTIRLDSGETVVVVYPERDGGYVENERVQVYTTSSGATRVAPNGVDPNFDPDVEAYEVDEMRRESAEAEPVDWFARAGAPAPSATGAVAR